MTFPLQFVLTLGLFAALMLAATLQALAASGHFPRETRRPAMTRGAAPFLLWVSIGIAAAGLLAGLGAAWHSLPWQAAVIAGGLAVLAAPVVLQQCPDRFVDGPAALLSFAALSAACAVLLLVVAAPAALQ